MIEQTKRKAQTMPEKLVWSVEEAGSALGLSPWTIRRYIKTRKLTEVRLGRRVFVEPVECRRLVEEGRRPLGEPSTKAESADLREGALEGSRS